MALVFLLLHEPDRPGTNLPLKDKLLQINALGFVCLVPGIVCLCLVLQLGGTTFPVSLQSNFSACTSSLGPLG